MKLHLITGACGFVGRNMTKRLYNITNDQLLLIDDLSIGLHPSKWFPGYQSRKYKDLEIIDKDGRVFFLQCDLRNLLFHLRQNPEYIQDTYNIRFDHFADVYHFAAIVGGRLKIEGDPMMVALDLSIDAELFFYLSRNKPERVLYPSSSAAYPVSLQTQEHAVALKEEDIDFNKNLGVPDMTYGWSKMTGEYLAKLAANNYGLRVVCIRPFSGYGEDQDESYPIPALAMRAARRDDPFEVWGTGKQARDFIHIDDIIDFSLLLMDKVSDGSSWNIGTGKLTSFLEIIDIFTSFAGYKPNIKPLTDKPVGVHARYADMSKVFNTFGWKPKITLEEGLRRVYDAALAKIKGKKL